MLIVEASEFNMQFYLLLASRLFTGLYVCGIDGSEKLKSDSKDKEESESTGVETQVEIVKHSCYSASKGTL